MSFADFKKNHKDNYGHVMEEMEKMNKGGSGFKKDERIWSLSLDKSNNGYALIRFLPKKDVGEKEDKLFYLLRYEHSYEYNGKYYIENCLTTVGIDGEQIGDCPQCSDNKQYWTDNSTEEDNDFARPRNRKKQYYANILVIDDPSNPSNNGKVFILRFGKQIKEKIEDKLAPKTDREKPIYVDDMWEGCNFKIKAFMKKSKPRNYVSYETSEWETQSPIHDDDKRIEEIYNNLYDIDEFRLADKFKSEEKLAKRVREVCYGEKVAKTISEKKEKEEETSDTKDEKTELPLEDKENEIIAEKKAQDSAETPDDVTIKDGSDTSNEFPEMKDDASDDENEEAENDNDFFKKFKS